MRRDLKDVFREAFELPESERATLAGLLIESLEPPPEPEVEGWLAPA
jgi:Mg2+/Co2+ transporter CorB